VALAVALTVALAARASAPLHRAAPLVDVRARVHNSLLTPAETFKIMEDEGAKRSLEPFEKLLWKGLAAGMLIGTGGILCSSVGGDIGGGEFFWAEGMGIKRLLFGAFGYPLSIICVAATGSSAFTGNLAFAGAALRSGRATPGGAFQMALATFLGCLMGCVFMGVLTHVCDLPAAIPTIAIAQHKAHLTIAQTIGRGIGGGWLIALAITLATAATKGGGNFADLALAVWFPISTYVICDFEHSLANMFFFTAAILSGGEFETADVVKNLVCSTAGNIIGAGVLVGAFLPWASGPTEIDSRQALLNAYSRLVSTNNAAEEELCGIEDEQCMEESIALEVKKAELIQVAAAAGYGGSGKSGKNKYKKN